MTEAVDAKVAKLIKVFIKMRDARVEIANRDKEVEEQMDVVKAEILGFCNTLGLDNFKTPFGRVVRKKSTRYWPSDWHMMYEFIREHDVPELLEKRIHQTNMATYLEENPTLHPPSLNADSEYSVVVYRK